jgi:hypothetical protein
MEQPKMYKEKIVDALTGEETWRDYTEAEIAEVEAAQVKSAQREAEAEAKGEAKAKFPTNSARVVRVLPSPMCPHITIALSRTSAVVATVITKVASEPTVLCRHVAFALWSPSGDV